MRYSKLLIILFLFITTVNAFSITIGELNKLAKDFKKDNSVVLNFERIDIKLLSYFMSALTGKNIVYDQSIKGEVSLIFNTPVSINEAWDIYTTILKSRNYVVIDRGSFVEIIPENLSRKTTPPVVTSEGKSEELVTFVYRLEKSDITQILNILRGLKSPRGMVFSYNPAGVIIITDTRSNIASMKKVISFIENSTSLEKIKIYNLSYATSGEVTTALNSLLSDKSKKGITVKIMNLRSQNSLLVKAPESLFKEIDKIIKEIDNPSSVSNVGRKFWILKLKNSKAEEIANVLNKLLQNISLIVSTSPKQEKNVKNLKGKNVATFRPKTVQSSKDRPKVVAEKNSNTLIIYGSKSEFEAIKDIVENLDKEKKQILITALITEVSEKVLKELGIRWQLFGTYGGAAFKGGISQEGFYNLVGATNFAVGALSTSGKTVNIAGTPLFFPDLLFLFSALERGTGFNIISSPKILTMENKEAVINVSQVTPFAQSLKFDVNGNPIINYDYREVGLKLKVTPHISGKNIIMELHQEVNDVIGFEKPQIGQISYVVPITSKREINTSITVENGKTVVLGGLVSKKTIKTMEGVPLLSKIPVIGNLFKYKSNESDKTNLFVFITPYIINTPEDLAKITEEHKKLVEILNKKEREKSKIEKKEKRDSIEDYREKYFQ